MPFKEFVCPVCEGQRNIEIGQEINDEKIETQTCPACNGAGSVYVEFDVYNYENSTWKRLTS